MRRRLSSSILVMVATLACPSIATAGTAGGTSAAGDQLEAWVISATGGGVSGSRCGPWEHAIDWTGASDASQVASLKMVDGVIWELFTRDCAGTRQWVWVPRVTGRDVARLALNLVRERLPAPTMTTTADVDGDPNDWTFVQFPTWFWTDPGSWGPVSAQASIPGVTATVTATPRVLRFTPGDGSDTVECEGPGQVFDTASPAMIDDANGCTQVYRHSSSTTRSGSFAASISIVWDVSFTASDGSTGTFDPLTRTTTRTMQVAELQSLVVADG